MQDAYSFLSFLSPLVNGDGRAGPIEVRGVAKEAALHGEARGGGHVVPLNGDELRELLKEAYGVVGAEGLVHEGEAEQQAVDAADDVVAGDGAFQPGFEGGETSRGEGEDAAGAQAAGFLHCAAHQAANGEAV